MNHEEDNHILVDYEKLFKMCFHCGMRRLEGHVCLEVDADDGCFMIDRAFEDKPIVFPEDIVVDEDIKANLHKDVMLCFPSAANVEDEFNETEEPGQRTEEEGWTTVVPKWKRRAEKRKCGENLRDEMLYKEVVGSPKHKCAARADLVQYWGRPGKTVAQDQEVSTASDTSTGVSTLVSMLFILKNNNGRWKNPSGSVSDALITLVFEILNKLGVLIWI